MLGGGIRLIERTESEIVVADPRREQGARLLSEIQRRADDRRRPSVHGLGRRHVRRLRRHEPRAVVENQCRGGHQCSTYDLRGGREAIRHGLSRVSKGRITLTPRASRHARPDHAVRFRAMTGVMSWRSPNEDRLRARDMYRSVRSASARRLPTCDHPSKAGCIQAPASDRAGATRGEARGRAFAVRMCCVRKQPDTAPARRYARATGALFL